MVISELTVPDSLRFDDIGVSFPCREFFRCILSKFHITMQDFIETDEMENWHLGFATCQ